MQQTSSQVSTSELEKWIDDYSRSLLDRAYYLLSNKEDAEDAVQEVFLSACKNSSSFQRKSSPQTWLMGILHHKVADIYKKRYKGTAVNLDFEQVFDKNGEWNTKDVLNSWEEENSASTNLLDDEDFSTVFHQCLEHLPKQWRLAVNLCYLQEKKTVDICTELNISSANYWKLLQRSRIQLRECIDIHWFNK